MGQKPPYFHPVQSYSFEREYYHLFISPRDNTCKAVLIFKGVSDKADSVSPKLVLDYLCWLMINIFTSKSGYKANSLKEKTCYSIFPLENTEENSVPSHNPDIQRSATTLRLFSNHLLMVNIAEI